jgi:uncharacterized damage-inducible protein DinB
VEVNVALKEVLLDEIESTYAIVENLTRQVEDAELLWTPSEGRNWMSMGQLLMHCAAYSCGKAIRGFVRGEWPKEAADEVHVPPAASLPTVQTVREALDLLAEDRRLSLECIGDTRETDLLGCRMTAPWGGRELTLFQQLLEMIKHLDQHKGQLFYYLKLMGKKVDSRDLWGM